MPELKTGRDKIDSVLAYVFLKSILTNPATTDAFRLGLIDAQGHIKKEPETHEEKISLTVLDKIGFKIRRLLGAKISELSSFAYIKSSKSRFQNQLSTNSVEKKALIKRVMNDIKNLTESHDIDFEDVARIYLNEEMKNFGEWYAKCNSEIIC